MDNWDDLRFVLALSRHGTMTAAARALGTNVATVSRRIDRINEAGPAPFFVKASGGWRATPQAAGLIEAAETFAAEIERERANAAARAGTEIVRLRIAAAAVLISSVLMPGLGRLVAGAPNLRLSLANRVQAEGLGDADLFIRFGRPSHGRLIARRVGCLTFRAYKPTGSAPPRGAWVGLAEQYDDRPHSLLGAELFGTPPVLRCDLFEHKVAAMKATGLPGVIPDIVGAADPGLEPMTELRGAFAPEFWLAYHQSRREDAVLRQVADWVVACFDAAGAPALAAQ